MTIKNRTLQFAVGFLLTAFVASVGLAEPVTFTLEFGNVAKVRSEAREMILVLDNEVPVSAMQFLINLEGTGLRFVHAKSCMEGLPDTHKGEGALSSCRVLEKGQRLMVAVSDLAGMSAIPNGYIGTVKVAPAHDKGLVSAGKIEDVGLWGQDKSELKLGSNRSPILVSFE